MLFLFGSLIALATGYSIVNPDSSPIRLEPSEEKAFRRRQLAVAFCLTAVLGLLFLVKQVRESLLIWVFIPIIVMPVVLLLREMIVSAAFGCRSASNAAGKMGSRRQ